MHIQAKIHRWVIWWFYVGLIFGIVALANILGRDDLTRADVRLILAAGVFFWLLGGLLCYAGEGIRIEEQSRPLSEKVQRSEPIVLQPHEWHAASDFLLPGTRKSLIRRDYATHHRDLWR